MRMSKALTALIAGAGIGLSGHAFAEGTPAGETVTNKVTLEYKVSSVPQVGLQSEVDFIVDTKIDMTYTTALSTASTVIPGADISPTYTLVNEGNASQAFKIEIAESTAQFDAPTISALTQVSGTCSIGGTTNKTITLAADATCEFTIDFTFPTKMGEGLPADDNIVNGDTFVLRSTVTAVTDATGETNSTTSATDKNADLNAASLTVLAEEDTSVTAPHVAYDGKIIVDTATITVSTANFSGTNGLKIEALVVNDPICDATYDPVTETYGKYDTAAMGEVICDDTDYTPKAIPGALVEYTLTATNEGAVAASDVEFKQAIADIVYGTGTTTLAAQDGSLDNLSAITFSGAATPVSSITGDNISVTVSTFEAGANISFTFTAIVE